MRQTLFRIPLDGSWELGPFGEVPAFGFGIVLVLWILGGLVWGYRLARRERLNAEHVPNLIVWLIGAALIVTAPGWGGNLVPNGIPIYGYGFMLFLGFLAAQWTAIRRAERIGWNRDVIWDLGLWIFVSGILGARLFYLIQYRERVFQDLQGFDLLKKAVNLPDGGLVLYGGVIVGMGGYFLFCRLRRLNPLLLADVIIPSIFIGLAFGRFGCFLNGCCYGDRCSLPWAVSFPQDSVPYYALVNRGFLTPDAAFTPPLHPTQLYSSLNGLLLAFLTATYFKYRSRDGAVLAVGWLAYPISRFVLEILRGDELGQFNTALTISQWVSIGLFASGLLYLYWLLRQPAQLSPGAQFAPISNAESSSAPSTLPKAKQSIN